MKPHETKIVPGKQPVEPLWCNRATHQIDEWHTFRDQLWILKSFLVVFPLSPSFSFFLCLFITNKLFFSKCGKNCWWPLKVVIRIHFDVIRRGRWYLCIIHLERRGDSIKVYSISIVIGFSIQKPIPTGPIYRCVFFRTCSRCTKERDVSLWQTWKWIEFKWIKKREQACHPVEQKQYLLNMSAYTCLNDLKISIFKRTIYI